MIRNTNTLPQKLPLSCRAKRMTLTSTEKEQLKGRQAFSILGGVEKDRSSVLVRQIHSQPPEGAKRPKDSTIPSHPHKRLRRSTLPGRHLVPAAAAVTRQSARSKYAGKFYYTPKAKYTGDVHPLDWRRLLLSHSLKDCFPSRIKQLLLALYPRGICSFPPPPPAVLLVTIGGGVHACMCVCACV